MTEMGGYEHSYVTPFVPSCNCLTMLAFTWHILSPSDAEGRGKNTFFFFFFSWKAFLNRCAKNKSLFDGFLFKTPHLTLTHFNLLPTHSFSAKVQSSQSELPEGKVSSICATQARLQSYKRGGEAGQGQLQAKQSSSARSMEHFSFCPFHQGTWAWHQHQNVTQRRLSSQGSVC